MASNPLLFLTSSWPWRSFAYTLSGAAAGLVILIVGVAYMAAGILLSPVVIGIVLLSYAAVIGVPIGMVERWRLRLMASPDRPPPTDPHVDTSFATARERLAMWRSEPASVREFGYAILLALLFMPLNFLVAIPTVIVTALLFLTPFLTFDGQVDVLLWRAETFAEGLPIALLLAPVWLVLSAYAQTVVAGAQAEAARALLGPRNDELEKRIASLRRSRLDLVSAFETERRRIERHLHDGVQQRLVGLTMTLGLAETKLPDGEWRALVERAHGEAEAALGDLRDAVRGIHPRVLVDHGLLAAVNEITDRSPLPVTVDLDVGRLPSAVEETAYFVVSEALTNAIKHAHAGRVRICGAVEAEQLRVEITDDGRGGASVVPDGGLAGLVTRLDALGGTLSVSSPAEGPTTVTMEAPCQVEA